MQPTVMVSGHDAAVGALGAPGDQTGFHAELAKESALVDFQEISAPLVHVVVCETAADMIVLANQQTQFLKQAYCAVFSDSFDCIGEYAQHLSAPTVVFNDLQVFTESHLRDASVLAFFTESKAVMWTHHTALSRYGSEESHAPQGIDTSTINHTPQTQSGEVPRSITAIEDAAKTAPDVRTIETHFQPGKTSLTPEEEAAHVMDTSTGDVQTAQSSQTAGLQS
jgi:hypothetical protein